MTKAVYLYDGKTGEYKGVYNAQRSPFFDAAKHPAAEEFIVPTHATAIAPPTVGTNEVAVFSGDVWVIQPDFREATVWDQISGEPMLIAEIGALPHGYGQTRPYLWSDHQNAVRMELDKVTGAGGTVIRCLIAGIELPAEWKAYIKALREIVAAPSGDPAHAFPARPAYPADT